MIDEKAINCFKTYLVTGYAREPKIAFPKELTRLILKYAYYESWMKVAEELTILLNKPELNFITQSDLWKKTPSLSLGRKWLLEGSAKSVFIESDVFYHQTISPLIQFLATCKLVDKDGLIFLMWAARDGHTETVKALLAVPGIEVNAVSMFSMTALMWAAYHGHTEVVKALLAVPGIAVNATAEDGRTALIWAATNGHTETVKALLAVSGVEVNAVSKNRETALMWAALRGHTEVVKALLEVPGIEVNVADGGGSTALMWAGCKGYTEIMNLIHDHNAEPQPKKRKYPSTF